MPRDYTPLEFNPARWTCPLKKADSITDEIVSYLLADGFRLQEAVFGNAHP
jgi:hypothetical protein